MGRQHPNILLIMTDQQRFDTIGALGNPVIRTPALDRLVRAGTAFTRAYTPSPVCVSARCSLLTGLPPHRTGCVDNMPMPQETTSMMQRLAEVGYQGHGVGKMHFVPNVRALWGMESRDFSEEGGGEDEFRTFINRNGYEHVLDPHGMRSEMYYIPQPSQLPARLHHSTWVTDRSIAFLQRRDRSRPFFLWSSFIKPHPPFENPTPWNKLYRCADMPLPKRPEGWQNLLTYWNHVQNRYKYRDQGVDDNLIRTMRAAYYGCISFVDYNVGRLLDYLQESGEWENTLILFTSDHGELLGDYHSFGKRCMLDSAARIPLLACWPGHFPAGARCDAPTSLLDIAPTLLKAAGVLGEEDRRYGDDLAAIATGDVDRRVVFSQFQQGSTGQYMAVTREWKYIYSAADNREWLFDLVTDPEETRNRAENPMYRTEVTEMREVTIRQFREDQYTAPLEGNDWKVFPKREIPADPDAGLLFQDAKGSTAIPAPGYERRNTVSPGAAYRLLQPPK
ncbi:MAG: sulfatase-like hydrolase/transferase [Armatimonadota bacterium]|nr:sulfatase-like hydrolase/transferase [Armatimonadota bacterium]